MKSLLAAVVILSGLALTSGGCATPAYSGHERAQLIGRNWGYEWAQAQDDIDNALLLRPASHMTIWHVQ
jgi:hypothetical protein